MTSSLRSLLDGIIDYAGLFPPSKLDMMPALKEYLRVKDSEEAWLVSRMIVPASRLEEFASCYRQLELTREIGISVLGTGGSDLASFEEGLEKDAKSMDTFDQSYGELLPIEAYEVKCPVGDDLAASIQDLRAFDHIELFVELGWEEGLTERISIAALHEHVNLKARTGGTDASAFPSAECLARFLLDALDYNVPFKLTAGLHHPLYHWNDSVGAHMHGFLNILGGLGSAIVEDLNESELASILTNESAAEFEVRGSSLRVGDILLGEDVLEEVRSYFLGYGSCSVSEPVEDLKKMGLWS